MSEEEGFEPPDGSPRLLFSRQTQSATLPLFQGNIYRQFLRLIQVLINEAFPLCLFEDTGNFFNAFPPSLLSHIHAVYCLRRRMGENHLKTFLISLENSQRESLND